MDNPSNATPEDESRPVQPGDEGVDEPGFQPGDELVTESETDRLANAVSGSDDQVGMVALWRVTMQLDYWWFLAVGEEDEESPAAAEIDGQQMLLAFTSSSRLRHFAIEQGMIDQAEEARAIALLPSEAVEAAPSYERANIDGIIFDPHISGYFIPNSQLPILWDAIMAPETETSGPVPTREKRAQAWNEAEGESQ